MVMQIVPFPRGREGWLALSLHSDYQAVPTIRAGCPCPTFTPMKGHTVLCTNVLSGHQEVRTSNSVHPEGHLFLIRPKILHRLALGLGVQIRTIPPGIHHPHHLAVSYTSQANESKIQTFARNKSDVLEGLSPGGRQMQAGAQPQPEVPNVLRARD